MTNGKERVVIRVACYRERGDAAGVYIIGLSKAGALIILTVSRERPRSRYQLPLLAPDRPPLITDPLEILTTVITFTIRGLYEDHCRRLYYFPVDKGKLMFIQRT